jgi:hypothetical protein
MVHRNPPAEMSIMMMGYHRALRKKGKLSKDQSFRSRSVDA